MAKTTQFMFDFASPNAYLAYKVMPGLLARTGAALEMVPCLLGGVFKATGNQAPMVAFAGVPAKLAYERLELRRFIDRHGLDRFRANPHFPINSLLAMRGLVAAQARGEAQRYLDAVLEGFWEDERPMADPEVLRGVLDKSELDGAALLAATQDQAVKDRLAQTTAAAVARGVFGIPTFFVGEEMFFGKDRLDQVEEAAG